MLKKNNVRAVFFDLDDTLYLEKDFATSGFRAVADYLAVKYNLKQSNIFNILESDFKRGVRGINFNLLLKKLNLPAQELKKLITIYQNHNPEISLYKDAKIILKCFTKNKKIKTGLITDGPVKMQKNKIKALKIDKIFDVAVFSDSLGKKYRKPHIKPFITALKKTQTKPQEAIYVADNPGKDFIGAKKIGIFTIRIIKKGGLYGKIKETINNKADLDIFTLIKLRKLCVKK